MSCGKNNLFDIGAAYPGLVSFSHSYSLGGDYLNEEHYDFFIKPDNLPSNKLFVSVLCTCEFFLAFFFF